MYSIEQVKVPPELGTVMKQYTKALLRDQPQDVYKYSANFFSLLCGRPPVFDKNGQLCSEDDAMMYKQDTTLVSAQMEEED